MAKRQSELTWTPDGMVARVRLRGSAVLSSPMLNRGTAFTLAERQALGLTGLLPDGVSTIEGQLARLYAQYRRQPDDLAKNLYLASLRDRNEVLLGSSQDTAETGNRMILMLVSQVSGAVAAELGLIVVWAVPAGTFFDPYGLIFTGLGAVVA
jgi:hypothetical protein